MVTPMPVKHITTTSTHHVSTRRHRALTRQLSAGHLMVIQSMDRTVTRPQLALHRRLNYSPRATTWEASRIERRSRTALFLPAVIMAQLSTRHIRSDLILRTTSTRLVMAIWTLITVDMVSLPNIQVVHMLTSSRLILL